MSGITGASLNVLQTLYPTVPAVVETVAMETPEEEAARKEAEEKAVVSPQEAAFQNALNKQQQKLARLRETQRVRQLTHITLFKGNYPPNIQMLYGFYWLIESY